MQELEWSGNGEVFEASPLLSVIVILVISSEFRICSPCVWMIWSVIAD